MPSPPRVCPYCQGLNSPTEPRCFRCGRRLPGPLGRALRQAFETALGTGTPVTRLLIGLSLLVTGLAMADEGRFPPLFSGGFRPSTLLRFGALVGDLGALEPWRNLTAVFVHINVLHVVVNMFSLAYLGRVAEHQFGSARYSVLYLVTGVAGFAVSDLWYGADGPLTAGASGAIFGLLGAIIGAAFARRDPLWKNALIENLVWAVILSLALRVNNAAHAGGFVVGALAGVVYHWEYRRGRRDAIWAVFGALGIACVLASLWLANASPIWRLQRQAEQRFE